MTYSVYNQNDINLFVKGEETAQIDCDIIYREWGYEVSRKQANYKKDCVISKGGYSYKIEEKFRSSDYGDFLIEIIQALESGQLGWLYHCEADYLHYVICKKWHPYLCYQVKWKPFRGWFYDYLQKKEPVPRISTKGKGITLNFAVGWYEIPEHLYTKLDDFSANRQGKLF